MIGRTFVPKIRSRCCSFHSVSIPETLEGIGLRLVVLAMLLGGSGADLTAQEHLSLHDAIVIAQTGPAATAAEAQVEEYRGGLRQAGLAPNPRLFLQSEDIRPWAGSFDFTTQTEDYAYLSQTLEVDGKRSKRVALGKARLGQAEAMRDVRMRQIAGAVTLAYWNAVGLEHISDLLKGDMAAVHEMVKYHEQRVEAGAMRGVDLMRMQIEQDRLKTNFAQAQRDAKQAHLELFRRMGKEYRDVQLSDSIEVPPAISDLDPKTAVEQRPDVRAAREALVAAEADLRLQRANAKPDLDLLGGYKRNSADNTIFTGLQLPLPVWNRNQGEIQRAEAGLNVATANLALLENQALLEVKQSRESYASQLDIVQNTLPQMRERARKNLTVISEAYRIGGVDLLRFIDAERTEFDVEVSAMHTWIQLQQSAVQLQLAEGAQP
jgi:cobalt-zinc-cadmium efflux system outer membrane protein